MNAADPYAAAEQRAQAEFQREVFTRNENARLIERAGKPKKGDLVTRGLNTCVVVSVEPGHVMLKMALMHRGQGKVITFAGTLERWRKEVSEAIRNGATFTPAK